MRYKIWRRLLDETIADATEVTTTLEGNLGAEHVSEQFAAKEFTSGDPFTHLALSLVDADGVHYTADVDVVPSPTFSARIRRVK